MTHQQIIQRSFSVRFAPTSSASILLTTRLTLFSSLSGSPPKRGVLSVTPCQLRLAPPSSREIDRLKVLTELRERTEQSAAAQCSRAAYRFPLGDCSEDSGIRVHREPSNASNVFLRVRILPSGPWAFTRVFRMPHPRPADYATNAGEL